MKKTLRADKEFSFPMFSVRVSWKEKKGMTKDCWSNGEILACYWI